MNANSSFLFLPIVTALLVNFTSCSELAKSKRTGKFFGVGLVRFENGICTSLDGLKGTCLTRRQCRKIDGIGSSPCAKGIGVCCMVQKSCGEKTSQNNTYFVSPITDSSTCTLTIEKESSDICQARIEFLTLNLAQPDANGDCVSDALVVNGGASRVPVICGENSGQHIYVDFDKDADIQLAVYAGSSTLTAKRWNIKVSQIACNCPWKAPSGCLMYHTELSGTIKSLNFGTTSTSNGTRQIANENYGVCISERPGYCSIRYAANAGTYSFAVSNNTNLAASEVGAGTEAAALTGCNCTSDFIVIPNPQYENGTQLGSDRFCGNGFVTVTTESKPFVLRVVTDGNEVNDGGNRGFSLQYTQQILQK